MSRCTVYRNKVLLNIGCALALALGGLGAEAAWDGSAASAAPPAQADPIYALPGTLELATGQSFLTYFVTMDGTRYAIFGATPQVEADITRFRDGAPGTVVKVWGDLHPSGQQYPGPEIIATDVEEAGTGDNPTQVPPTSVPPTAVGRFDYVNLHADPDQMSAVVGQIVLEERCAVIGRNASNSWLLVRCEDGEGWAPSTVVRLEGDLGQAPIVGQAGVSRIPMVVVGSVTPTPAPVTGWRALYYANRDLQGEPVLVQDAPRIEFDWGMGSPGPAVPADNFSASFERTINFEPGPYRMCLCNVDDGARMWIDDELVLNDWRESPARDLIVDRQLSGPKRIRIEYFEAVNAASIRFTYTAGGERQDMWQASYWNNTVMDGPAVMARSEPRPDSTYVLDYNWGRGSPAPGVINSDIFSARWEGVFYFEAGSYVFNALSDDGLRVYVDGTLVLYGWEDGYQDLRSGVYSIGQGQHRVRVDYYERTGDALIRLGWYRDEPMLVQ